MRLPRQVIWFADCLTLVPGQQSCLVTRHDRKSGDWVPEGSTYMLFVVQGVASIQKAVLFIKAVCSAQPSLVALMDRLGRSDPVPPPTLNKNVGETNHSKFSGLQNSTLATLAENKYRN